MSINDDILYKIDSEIEKDKEVVKLRKEIERLNQEIIGLNNCIIKFHTEFCNKQAKINRLNNIIDKIELALELNIEDLKENSEMKSRVDEDMEILRFIKELKGSDKE